MDIHPINCIIPVLSMRMVLVFNQLDYIFEKKKTDEKINSRQSNHFTYPTIS